MKVALPAQRPVSYGAISDSTAHFKIKPFLGFFANGRATLFSQQLWRREFPLNGVSYGIIASADFSRRRQTRASMSGPKGSGPRGFMPKTPLGTSTRKSDQRNTGEKDPSSPTSSKYVSIGKKTLETDEEHSELTQGTEVGEDQNDEVSSSPTFGESDYGKKTLEMKVFAGEKQTFEIAGETKDPSTSTSSKYVGTRKMTLIDEQKTVELMQGTEVGEDINDQGSSSPTSSESDYGKKTLEMKVFAGEKQTFEITGETKDPSTSTSSKYVGTRKMTLETDEQKTVELMQGTEVGEDRNDKGSSSPTSSESDYGKKTLEMKVFAGEKQTFGINKGMKGVGGDDNGKVGAGDNVTELQKIKPIAKSDAEHAERPGLKEKILGIIKGDASEGKESIKLDENRAEDTSLKIKLEMEANFLKKVIARLAEENFSGGNKMFYYPQVVTADQDVKVFLNKSLSTLNNEADVMIMGAFNDWRWKSFTTKLNKTDLPGDWWSCEVHIPKEAYKMDFVFFNGGNAYDNNNKNDFCIPIDSEMDALAFEDFLLEEKHRELEKLAKEQAERERQAEEQRRIEAEKAGREADRAQAREEAGKRREMLHHFLKKAVVSVDNVWFIEPHKFKGDDLVRFYYNRSSGPLAHANHIWIHGGHNNWKDGLSIVGSLIKDEKKEGDWWYVEVSVPKEALVLDWVFADGPPQRANLYDNNHHEDFHAIVPQPISEELYWVEEEHQIYKKLQEERRLREDAIRAKVERTAQMKAETKERTLQTFLLSQKHIVYTEPLDVQAGSTISVLYNPSNTVLNGKSEIWFRCSFNRWTHRRGSLPPQRMLPVDSGPHLRATVKVPLDAYMMDFVFSEREDGGIFDNRNGMDYHIPVSGSVVKEPPMHIVHIAVEMAPIAKVGGLGDVVTSLSRAIQELNHNVDIILPKYDCLKYSNVRDLQFNRSYSWGGTEIKAFTGKVEGLSVYFLEPQNGFFSAGCIYGCKNDGERFGFFCHAALEFLLQSGFHPDIIHCHDWSSAPVAWLFKDHYMHYGLSKARVVFTIHNLEFGAPLIEKAMAYTDKATTVSNTYSREVSGNPAIAPHLHKFHGILNGIDPDIWDPYNDKFIPVPYTSENVIEGKRAAKEALQQRLGLQKSDLPLVGIITRLTHQKGIHLIKHAIKRTLERNGQVVLLGSAPDPRIQNDFVNLANQLHSSQGDRAQLCLTYDEPLSHLIYAGADFILVPSIFEPCGLTQLIAMRYGSIPVVRKTGGLYDTVFDVDHDKERAQAQGLEPNGFNFDGADPGGVDYALNRAISGWYEGRTWFNSLCKRVMEQDWSWNRPALDYMELYHAARK